MADAYEEKTDIEQTLVLIKPDGIKRSLTGNIIALLAHPDNIIVGAKLVKVSRELAIEHYINLKHKPFFDELINYFAGDGHTNRIFALVYEGKDIIQRVRERAGATNPEDAKPETIRGKYGRIHSKTGIYENVIHCSENKGEAEREIKLWFEPDEIVYVRFPVEFVEQIRRVLRWKD
ncbi:MAG: nucleoside-diphosphate kinase [Spirochaetales bacterium]|nr:nucleoside-diphosphate kinase [Spirochaetales bacterium]